MITETWLRNHLDAELGVTGYSLFRTDRDRPKKRRGRNSGGVAIYMRDDLAASCEVLLQHSSGVIEALCLRIRRLNIIVCVVYRQPDDLHGGNRSTAVEFQSLINSLSRTLNDLPSPTPDILVTGDFNLPRIAWPQCTSKPGSSTDEKAMIQILSDFMAEFFFQQTVLDQTHRAGNILDLILCNNIDILRNHNIIPTEPVSSHYLVTVDTTLSSPQTTDIIPVEANIFDRLNLKSEKTDWNAINVVISQTDWDHLFANLSVTEMLDKVMEVCEHAVSDNSPTKPRRKRANPIPRERKILMRKRNKLRKQLLFTERERTESNIKAKLVDIERDLQISYRMQEDYEEEKAVSAIKNNPKYFYSYAKARYKTQPQVGPFLAENGDYITEPSQLADMLSEQYKSAFSTPLDSYQIQPNHVGDSLEDVFFSETHIKAAIDEVGSNAAAGPDRFPAVLLKKCRDALARPLYLLWRASLDSGIIPSALKTSVITPIYKGGDRQQPKNYRPVALTSHLVKFFEKIIRKNIVHFLESRNLLNPNQHGFRTGHSCLSQLVQHYDRILQSMEAGKNVDIIYLDFAKAFDKLDFAITLGKLRQLGISGRVYAWIESFLTNRQQVVHVRGSKSEMEPVVSGVPQGSVLGPLLFLVLLGDIDETVSTSYLSSFADDTRVLGQISGTGDVDHLQRDLDAIYDWSRKNNAQLNAEKFECIRYGYNQEIKTSTNYKANNGSPIESKSSVRDLGVLMSSDANFGEHIGNVVLSANLKCAWVLRTFKTREIFLMLTLWRSLVVPVLDYCCQLWSPAVLGQIQKLEKVQASFFKKFAGMARLTYWQQLEALKAYSLQRRRERYAIIYIWKALEGLVPNFGVTTVDNSRHGRSCRVPHIKTSAPCKIQTLRFASLTVNGPRLFNSMPNHIRNMTSCSIDTFKHALDKHLENVPDEPRMKELVPFCTRSSNSLLLMGAQN